MPLFQTIDEKGQTHVFEYEIDTEFTPTVTFRVYSINRDPNRFFEYSFSIIDKNTAKGETANHYNQTEFIKKGIQEKIIELASHELNRDIISSPINAKAGNFLVNGSKKAWERLALNNQNAEIDINNNRFIFKRDQVI